MLNVIFFKNLLVEILKFQGVTYLWTVMGTTMNRIITVAFENRIYFISIDLFHLFLFNYKFQNSNKLLFREMSLGTGM